MVQRIKKIIVILIFLIILLCCIIFITTLTSRKGKATEIIDTELADDTPPEKFNPQVLFQLIETDDVYFTIEKLLNSTITYIKQVNGIIAGQDLKDNPEVIQQGLEMLMNVLDKEYIEQYNITNQELQKKVSIYKKYNLKIDKIYESEESSNIFYYLIYATLDGQNFNTLIKTDTSNFTYSIFLADYVKDKNYTYDMTEEKMNFNGDRIEKNDHNTFKYTRISDQYMVETYLKNYKETMFSDIEKAYSLLNEKYKNKRFKTLEDFRKYVNVNKAELQKIEIDSYLKNTYKDYTEYVGKDQYGNVYVFESFHIMDYKVQLDDYTLPDEELDKKYMSLTTQEKVVNNVNKWIKMLNYRDYESAFNVLDETFRTQNFGNDVSKFEQYMRQKFPDHYKFNQVKYMQEAGISEQQITMSPISGGLESQIQETIYMQLREDTNFVMSFNII